MLEKSWDAFIAIAIAGLIGVRPGLVSSLTANCILLCSVRMPSESLYGGPGIDLRRSIESPVRDSVEA